MSFQQKSRLMQENIELSPENFYVTLFSTPTEKNKENVSTNFTNSLARPLFLKGEYELALSSIGFSKVGDLELGEITLTNSTAQSSYTEFVKISANMGQDYKTVFAKINEQIHEAIKRREFTRRLHLRKLHQVSSNVNVLKTDDGFISLPLKDNKIYDTIVYNEISEMTPQIIYKDNLITFKTNNAFTFSFKGNITKILTSIGPEKYDKNSIPITVPSKNLPDFNSSIVTADIIEEEFCQEGYLQILKCISLDLNESVPDRAVCKNYDQMIYKKIKKDVNNVVRTINSINIKIKTNLNQILSFEQGEVLVRLHLRKINDGL
jgi:hypothetical protein